MIRDSTGPSDTLDTHKFLAAQLAHRNRPNPATGLSSREVIFGRNINDMRPFAPEKLVGHREQVMAKHHLIKGQELYKHCRQLKQLQVSNGVLVQKDHGNNPLKWNNTGTFMETGNFDKYAITLDGSSRLTTRNR